MSSNEPETTPDSRPAPGPALETDPALRRAEAARDAVTEALEDHLDRLATLGRAARTDLDADLQAAGRLVARTTHRQLAANLALVEGLMAARTLSAMLQLQQDFLRRQMDWALGDWERMRAQALDLLKEGRQGAEEPDAGPPVSGAGRRSS
ncbi:hypothetical protein ASG63_05385 [Methylobacterium sp. Leaf94]|uniref:phasin family protein n=1 Tax=Methylobacterium sp. Leaf94 TaxID=1736250 RepID=UPI0006F7CAA1|nr:phasin family protein [Methylobacterium sp. Leaf94]KQU21059.1 hypothetical protein ASG63_05385 [Methylobacterium sp. Leaf94]